MSDPNQVFELQAEFCDFVTNLNLVTIFGKQMKDIMVPQTIEGKVQ